MTQTQPPSDTLHKPRILCLHGGGVNAEIFRLQCRTLITQLAPYFRLIYADAPFECQAGPGMIPVYENMGPYRRWLRWLPEHQPVADEAAISEIEAQMRKAMEADDAIGATGEWVGLLGFSQGAKVAASLLYESQLRREEAVKGGMDGMYGGWEEENVDGLAGGKWQFGVLMAGRAPMVSFSERSAKSTTMYAAGGVSEVVSLEEAAKANKDLLRLPTVHVHGLKDPGLHLHKKLLEVYCDPESATVVEWDGDHRIPLKSVDVKKMVDATLSTAVKAAVLRMSQLPEELQP